nr:hypothetical protein CFP56_54349 [Quercus suber]
MLHSPAQSQDRAQIAVTPRRLPGSERLSQSRCQSNPAFNMTMHENHELKSRSCGSAKEKIQISAADPTTQ